MSHTRAVMLIALSLVAVVVVCASFLRFSSRATAVGDAVRAPTTVLSRVRDTRVIRAGYFVSRPLVELAPGAEKPTGFGIDVLQRIAAQSGLKVEYQAITFSTMLAALDTGAIDVVAVPVAESPQRALSAAFTEPILVSGLSYICRKEDARFNDESDLDQPGVRIAVTGGASSHEYAALHLNKSKINILTGVESSRTLLEVVSGNADAAISTVASCYYFVREHPELRQVAAEKPFYQCGTGFVVPRGNTDWLNFLNSSLRHLHTTGVIAELDRKYNPDGRYWRLVNHLDP